MATPLLRTGIAQQGDYELVSDYNGVRVRSRPGLSGAIIGVVNAGGVVSITGQTVMTDGYSWIPVWVHGTNISGYVAGEFFRNTSGSQGWFRGTPVFVNTDGVNLRAGAGLGYRVIGNFSYGTFATVNDGPRQADGYAWYHITIDGLTGWMAANFLTMGYVDGPSPGPGQFAIGSNVRPTTSLNLRTNPGTGSSVVTTMAPTVIATVIGGPQASGGYSWYRLELWDQGKTTGWAAGAYLEGARFEPTGARHKVTDGPLNLRAWGGLGAPVTRSLPTGTIFVIADASMVSADGYTWAHVYLESSSSVRGWVALGFSVET